MHEEMKEKKDLQSKTEPQKGKDINAKSVHINDLRQNTRPYT